MTFDPDRLAFLQAERRAGHRSVIGSRLDDLAGRDLMRNGGDADGVIGFLRSRLRLCVRPAREPEASGNQQTARHNESGPASRFKEFPSGRVEIALHGIACLNQSGPSDGLLLTTYAKHSRFSARSR